MARRGLASEDEDFGLLLLLLLVAVAEDADVDVVVDDGTWRPRSMSAARSGAWVRLAKDIVMPLSLAEARIEGTSP
jgi:hypothetical protein